MNVLPNPLFADRYDIFYGFVDTLGVNNFTHVPKLMRTHLGMSENIGSGKVLYKDRVFNADTSNISPTAVKHGNGRD